MLHHPQINPVILHISDTLQIRWYGMMYLLSFAGCWLLLRQKTKLLPGWQDPARLNDIVFYSAIGVVFGGRLGYLLFYSFSDWLHDPLLIFKVWQGGMSFHGGIIGVCVALWVFARQIQYSFLRLGDLIAPVAPLALAAGRLGNFINGELWGRVTDLPWGMVFPMAGPLPRHPSPLYAMLLEGALLFVILRIYGLIPRPIGGMTGVFLMGYGIIRIFEEFFRQPDPQFGYIAFGWLTMGQLLSLPMVFIGLSLLIAPKLRDLKRVDPCKHT